MNKLEKKLLKKRYLNEQKERIEKDGFIFNAIAGFGDWADDLSEKEIDSHMCDASSPTDIKRWFNEIIYPGTTQFSGSSKEKLIEFLDLYNENKINQIIGGMYSSMAICALINFDESDDNEKVFFQTLAQLVSKKLDDMI